MLQGLAQFCVALAEFLEQPDVLDGDDRLVGEGFEERDLLVGERINLSPSNIDHPDGEYPPAATGGKHGPNPDAIWRASPEILSSNFSKVMDMNRFAVDDRSAGTGRVKAPVFPSDPRQRSVMSLLVQSIVHRPD